MTKNTIIKIIREVSVILACSIFVIYSLQNTVRAKGYTDYIKYAEHGGISIVQRDQFQGAVSCDGSMIIDCVYDAVMIPEFGLVRCVKDNKWGLFDVQGHTLLECKYDYISPFDRNHSLYNQWLSFYYFDGKMGFIRADGSLLTEAVFDIYPMPLRYLKMNGLPVMKDSLWGVISTDNGSVILEFEYESIDSIPYNFVFYPYGSEYYIIPQTDMTLTDGLALYDITAVEIDETSYVIWLATISNVYKNTTWILTDRNLEKIGIVTNSEYITDTYNYLDRGISRHYHKASETIVYLNVYGEIVQKLSNANSEWAWDAYGMIEWN